MKMNPQRTLWMGNIENSMSKEDIFEIFKKLGIKPLKINVVPKENNKIGCCFVEFDSPNTAKKVLANFNGQIINNLLLKLNWVNSHNNNNNNNSTVEKYSNNPNQKYTVKYIFNIFFYYRFMLEILTKKFQMKI
jgi:RNA recognition motif-containing protein